MEKIKNYVNSNIIDEHYIKINKQLLMYVNVLPEELINNKEKSMYFTLCKEIKSWWVDNMGALDKFKLPNGINISWVPFFFFHGPRSYFLRHLSDCIPVPLMYYGYQNDIMMIFLIEWKYTKICKYISNDHCYLRIEIDNTYYHNQSACFFLDATNWQQHFNVDKCKYINHNNGLIIPWALISGKFAENNTFFKTTTKNYTIIKVVNKKHIPYLTQNDAIIKIKLTNAGEMIQNNHRKKIIKELNNIYQYILNNYTTKNPMKCYLNNKKIYNHMEYNEQIKIPKYFFIIFTFYQIDLLTKMKLYKLGIRILKKRIKKNPKEMKLQKELRFLKKITQCGYCEKKIRNYKNNNKICKNCQSIFYCNKKCQKRHWKKIHGNNNKIIACNWLQKLKI